MECGKYKMARKAKIKEVCDLCETRSLKERSEVYMKSVASIAAERLLSS